MKMNLVTLVCIILLGISCMYLAKASNETRRALETTQGTLIELIDYQKQQNRLTDLKIQLLEKKGA